MKKILVGTLAILFLAVGCVFFASCGGKTVEQLTNELGALLEGGGFSADAVFNLDKIDVSEEKATEILDKLEDSGIAISDEEKAYIYDIFVTKNNVKVQPDGTVKVTLPAPDDEDAEGYNVYHVKDNGVIESISAIFENGMVSFETESFSLYVLVPTYNIGTMEITPTQILYLGTNVQDACFVFCDGKLAQTNPVSARAVNENSTVELRVEFDRNRYTFIGWFEGEDDSDVNFPILKSQPISTEEQYVFEMSEDGYALYAILAERNAVLYFGGDISDRGNVTVNGRSLEDYGFTLPVTLGKTYSFTAEAKEGYSFLGWDVIDSFNSEFVEGDSLELYYDGIIMYVNAIFEPIVTELKLDVDEIVYDVGLLEEYKYVTIPEFNALCEDKDNWDDDCLVYGRIKSISNYTWGNMILVDDQGNELHVFGLYSENNVRYELMEDKPVVGDYIAVHGTPYLYNSKPEMKKAYLLDSTPVLPNFERLKVYAVTTEGARALYKGDYEVNTDGLNLDKPGEYTVTYTYNYNTDITATVTVRVVAPAPVWFSTWVEGGTLLLNGIDIGADYYEEFSEGYGKITFTAVGEENTVFKGWYMLNDQSDTGEDLLISEEQTYTFEFTENTSVYALYEHVATEIYLDGLNMGFDTEGGITEIWLPVQGTYDPSRILVFAIINGEREALTEEEYTIDLNGFDASNPQMGDYVLTFTYNLNPELKASHLIRVLDEETVANIEVSVDAGGRLVEPPAFYQYNKGTELTLSVELRSEEQYEFLGWYSISYDATGASSGEELLSTDREYKHTLNESIDIVARIEPRITYLEVEGYEGEPTRINVQKFWLADREMFVYACGALGKRVELGEDDYTVDYGGLDLDNPTVGTYVITYTYNEDANVKFTVTVMVWEEDFSFLATVDNIEAGAFIFEGEHVEEAGGQFIKGEEVTITAVTREGFSFEGWYEVVSHDTHNEEVFLSNDVTYTFNISKDVKLKAKFEAIVTKIDLQGVYYGESGWYEITTMQSISINLESVAVVAYTNFGKVNLGEDDYTVDYGGLNLDNPTVGTYFITYTYARNTELSVSIAVLVKPNSYLVNVTSRLGRIEYNGEMCVKVYEMVEENTVITLKAKMDENDYSERVFLGWYYLNEQTGQWELYSQDLELTIKVNAPIGLQARFDNAIDCMHIHYNNSYKEAGIVYYNLEMISGSWDEYLGCYVAYSNVDIYSSSIYADDIVSLFEECRFIVVHTNGMHKQISFEDVMITCERIEDQYWLTISYGGFVCYVNVWIIQQ